LNPGDFSNSPEIIKYVFFYLQKLKKKLKLSIILVNVVIIVNTRITKTLKIKP